MTLLFNINYYNLINLLCPLYPDTLEPHNFKKIWQKCRSFSNICHFTKYQLTPNVPDCQIIYGS